MVCPRAPKHACEIEWQTVDYMYLSMNSMCPTSTCCVKHKNPNTHFHCEYLCYRFVYCFNKKNNNTTLRTLFKISWKTNCECICIYIYINTLNQCIQCSTRTWCYVCFHVERINETTNIHEPSYLHVLHNLIKIIIAEQRTNRFCL